MISQDTDNRGNNMIFNKGLEKRRGQSIVEYGILVMAVATAMMVAAILLSKAVDQKINAFEDNLVTRHQ